MKILNTAFDVNKYKYLGLFILPLIVFAGANTDGLSFLISKWLDFESGTYNHGFLLFGVSLYLIHNKVNISQDISNKWTFYGFLGSLCFAFSAFILGAVSIASLQILTLYGFVFSFVLAIFGWKVFVKILVPLGLLVFAFPVWRGLGEILQFITHKMSYFLVKMSGVPVLQDGYFLTVPAGSFEVTAGCSGLSYFLAGSALAVIYAIINYKSRKNILIVISAIVAASIIANWFRVLIIIIAGQMTNMQHSLIEDHFNLGWGIFGVMFMLLIVIFNKKLHEEPEGDVQATTKRLIEVKKSSVIYSVFFITLSTIFLSYQFIVNSEEINKSSDQFAGNIHVSSNFTSSTPVYAWEPVTHGANEQFFLSNNSTKPVQLYVGFIKFQYQGTEVVSDSNIMVNRDEWEIQSDKFINDNDVNVREYVLKSRRNGKEFMLWTWYRVDEKNTALALKAKIYELYGYLKGDNSASYVGLLMPKNGLSEKQLNDELLPLYKSTFIGH